MSEPIGFYAWQSEALKLKAENAKLRAALRAAANHDPMAWKVAQETLAACDESKEKV